MYKRQLQNIGLRTENGWNVSGDDVQIWLEEQGENSFAISAYCEKLLPMLREEEGRAWWMLTTCLLYTSSGSSTWSRPGLKVLRQCPVC